MREVNTLLIDNRLAHGDKPGVHVLIAGVGHYPALARQGPTSRYFRNFDKQLSSTVKTAKRLFEWLQTSREKLPQPLVTCRLLLSPPPSSPGLLSAAPACTAENFRQAADDWIEDASRHKQNTTVFFFSGHGCGMDGMDTLMMLEDAAVAENPDQDTLVFKNAVSASNLDRSLIITDGTDGEDCNFARNQFFFLDTCRERLDRSIRVENDYRRGGSSPSLPGSDHRNVASLHAAGPGGRAWALPDRHTIFGDALLAGLKGKAGVPLQDLSPASWGVTSFSLQETVPDLMRAALASMDPSPHVIVPRGQDGELCRLDGPPKVRVHFTIDPVRARHCTKVHLNQRSLPLAPITVGPPVHPHPHEKELTADWYTMHATVEPSTSPYMDIEASEERLFPPKSGHELLLKMQL